MHMLTCARSISVPLYWGLLNLYSLPLAPVLTPCPLTMVLLPPSQWLSPLPCSRPLIPPFSHLPARPLTPTLLPPSHPPSHPALSGHHGQRHPPGPRQCRLGARRVRAPAAPVLAYPLPPACEPGRGVRLPRGAGATGLGRDEASPRTWASLPRNPRSTRRRLFLLLLFICLVERLRLL